MGWHNSVYIDALREILAYVHEHAPIRVEPKWDIGHKAEGHGLKSEPDLLGLRIADGPHNELSERELAVRLWEGNIEALEDFLNYLYEALPQTSFCDHQHPPKPQETEDEAS